MKTCYLSAVAAIFVLAACGNNPAGPEVRTPGIHFFAGDGISDTVHSVPPQALTIQVIGPDGRPAAGTAVLFESGMSVPEGSNQQPTIWVGRVTENDFTTSLGDTTDTEGKASVRLRFGTRAGEGSVIITAPVPGFQVKATFEVLPGSAATVAIEPTDTAVYRGSSYSLRVSSMDRYGNARGDDLSLSVSSPAASASGKVITGANFGRVTITGTVGEVSGVAHLSIVPEGILAVYSDKASPDSSGIVVIGLDGSGSKRLAPRATSHADHMAPHWAPSGQEIVYTDGFRIDSDSKLFIVDMNGVSRRLIQSPMSGAESWGHLSPDGTWIYYTRWPDVWRVRPDGTDAEQAVPRSDGFGVDGPPAPSPDGSELAYGGTTAEGFRIRVMNLASGQVRTFGFSGNVPRWSPDGQWIAFRSEVDESIGVVRPDGTGLKTLSPPGRRYRYGHDWSPNGNWIIAAETTSDWSHETTRLNLLNVETGETLLLPYSTGMWQPAWKP